MHGYADDINAAVLRRDLELARLREALEPFAQKASSFADCAAGQNLAVDTSENYWGLTVGDLRRAEVVVRGDRKGLPE